MPPPPAYSTALIVDEQFSPDGKAPASSKNPRYAYAAYARALGFWAASALRTLPAASFHGGD